MARGWTSPLVVRAVTGVALAAIVVAVVATGQYGLWAMAVVLGGLSLWELRRLTAQIGYPAPTWLLFPLGAYLAFSGTLLQRVPLAAALGAVLLVGLPALIFQRPGGGFVSWALGVAGALYIGLPFNAFLVLYADHPWPRGTLWVLTIIATVVVTDIAAYLGGRSFGRRPFFPHVSPNKTLEGAVAGVLLAVPVMLLAGWLGLGLPVWQAALLGLLVGLSAELGDLVESQLKRLAGVKDSSHLIPGHGGVLDRIDSVLLPPLVVGLCLALFHAL